MRNMTLFAICVILVISFSVSFGIAGTFIDDFTDPAKTEATWEAIHRDWILKGGTYSSPGAAGLTQDPITLLPIEVEDGSIRNICAPSPWRGR